MFIEIEAVAVPWKTNIFVFLHSRSHKPRSLCSAPRIATSGRVHPPKFAIHGLPVKTGKSDWLRIRNEYSMQAMKIGSGQSSRSLPQARRIVGSGDENCFRPIRLSDSTLSMRILTGSPWIADFLCDSWCWPKGARPREMRMLSHYNHMQISRSLHYFGVMHG